MKDLKYLLFLVAVLCVYGLWQHNSQNRGSGEGITTTETDQVAPPIATDQDLIQQRATVADVWPLMETCKRMGQKPVVIQGTVLVWDMESGMVSPIQGMLPAMLQPASSDLHMTIFMLTKRSEVVGNYVNRANKENISSATQVWADFAVVYWPEKRAIGMCSIPGPPPSQTITVRNGSRVEDHKQPDWNSTIATYIIYNLPRR